MRIPAMGLLLSLPLVALAAGPATPESIDIFTTVARPVAHVTAVRSMFGGVVHYFRLDAEPRLDAVLSQDLPADPAKARGIALRRIGALDGSRLMQSLSESFEGLILARRYGVDRVPAIVFDGGKSVVYGVTDLREAVRRYRQSQTDSQQ